MSTLDVPSRPLRRSQPFEDLRARNDYRAHIELLRQRDTERSRRVQRILELNRHRIMGLGRKRDRA
jgi:hypothetical protein